MSPGKRNRFPAGATCYSVGWLTTGWAWSSARRLSATAATVSLPVMADGEGGAGAGRRRHRSFRHLEPGLRLLGRHRQRRQCRAFDVDRRPADRRRRPGRRLARRRWSAATADSFDADDRNSSGDSDNYHLGLYGGTNWGAVAFRTVRLQRDSISTTRSVAFNGFADSAVGRLRRRHRAGLRRTGLQDGCRTGSHFERRPVSALEVDRHPALAVQRARRGGSAGRHRPRRRRRAGGRGCRTG